MAVQALAIGLGAQVLGSIFGGGKRKKAAQMLQRRAQAALAETHRATTERLASIKDAFKGTFSQLSQMEDLDIDTTFADQAYSDAQRNAQSQFGRSLGEEMARDTVREQSANYIAESRNAAGSQADILGFLADTSRREQQAMQNIDMQSIQQREQRIQNAMGRLEAASARRQDFYQGKEQAEFNAARQRDMMLAELAQTSGLTIADTAYQNAQAMIGARNQVAQAGAGVKGIQADNISGLLGGVGSTLTQFALGDSGNQNIFDSLGFGGGAGRMSTEELEAQENSVFNN